MAWWIYLNGKVSEKTYSRDEMAELPEFTKDTQVCPAGEEEWVRAKEVKELSDLFNSETSEEKNNEGVTLPNEVKKEEKEKARERKRLSKNILKLVSKKGYRYGIKMTARVLVGSQHEKIKEKNLTENALYGELEDYKFGEMSEFIESMLSFELLEKREIKENKYAYYLGVTEKGKDVLAGQEPPGLNPPG